MKLKLQNTNEYIGNQILLYLKKQDINPIVIINTIDKNNNLSIVLKDDITLIAIIKNIRKDIQKINKNISINWNLINDNLIKISFILN